MSHANEPHAQIIGCDIGDSGAYAAAARGRDTDPFLLLPADIARSGMPAEARLSGRGEISVYPVDRRPEAREGGTVRFSDQLFRLDSVPHLNTESPVFPRDVYAAILRDLVRIAGKEAAVSGEAPYRDLVFTYPAALGSPDRNDLLDRLEDAVCSADLDGRRLNVAGRLPRAAASALQYLNHIRHVVPEGDRFPDDKLNVLVYDLGRCSFEVALVTVRDDLSFDLLLHDSDHLGSDDFVNALCEELCSRFYQAYQYKPSCSYDRRLLTDAARQLLSDLSLPGAEECPVVLEVASDDGALSLETGITRSRFEEIVSPCLVKTLEKTAALLSRAEREGLPVDRIVYTGSAGRLPIVGQSLRDLAGVRFSVESAPLPDCSASYGAALYGSCLPVRSGDFCAARDVGIRYYHDDGDETGYIVPFFRRGEALPRQSPWAEGASLTAEDGITYELFEALSAEPDPSRPDRDYRLVQTLTVGAGSQAGKGAVTQVRLSADAGGAVTMEARAGKGCPAVTAEARLRRPLNQA